MRKIIVTGGLGFIGSNLIELLLNKNFYVINIDKGTYSSNLYNTKDFRKSKKYKYLKLDISNKKIGKVFAKYRPSGIFNLAAETHVDRSIDNPGNFIQSNIVGVYNLLEYFKKFSKKYKSRLIHISTDEVYGDVLNGRSDEEYPYQQCKHPGCTRNANYVANGRKGECRFHKEIRYNQDSHKQQQKAKKSLTDARPRCWRCGKNAGYRRNNKTGIPSIVNTSFNMHEEPIVCSPEDAIRSFILGNIDVLSIGPFVCYSNEQLRRI